MQVIDTARDNLEGDRLQREAGIVDEDVSSSSDDSSDDDDDGKSSGIPDGSAKHKQGPIDHLRDYKKHDKGLHRRHRGIMQWKVCRSSYFSICLFVKPNLLADCRCFS